MVTHMRQPYVSDPNRLGSGISAVAQTSTSHEVGYHLQYTQPTLTKEDRTALRFCAQRRLVDMNQDVPSKMQVSDQPVRQ
jgi:hypothetical protein